MSINTMSIKDIAVVELEGSIDSATAPDVQKEVLSATENQIKVILDMNKVTYLSSAGLRMLLLVYRQIKARNGNIALVGLSEEIKDVMSNTGFIKFFVIADTIDDGVNVLAKQGGG
ncbi:MAG: anti-sigma B factor antagonist [Nitrospirae bacterium RBG_13_39_12]|nr:MAG: anti-sigma B factor antagonist [Nitrospirae bacterium RBG_13_39_12]